MDEPLAYLDGRWLPFSQAALPLTDAGFVQGTTLAEQLRTFGGRIFRLDDHLRRLFYGLEILGIDPGLRRDDLAGIAHQLVAQNRRLLAPEDDLGVSVFVTPGDYPSYSRPGPTRPLVGVHTYPLPFALWAAKYETGQSLRTARVRQVPPQCWPADLKCRSRMHYYLADREAALAEPGARAVLLDLDGFVTEASTANVLLYRREEGLVLPPLQAVLHGISQAVLCELATPLGLAVAHRPLRPEDVADADEVLLSSTPFGLLSVSRFDGHPVGAGRPGPVYHRLLRAWNDLVGVDVAEQARRFSVRA